MKTTNIETVTQHVLMKDGNTVIVGETGKPKSTQLRDIKIESAQERIISIDSCGGAVITMEDVSKLFRKSPKVTYIRAFKGSNPAYEYWVDKLKSGEKLPRGKYFKSCEFFR